MNNKIVIDYISLLSPLTGIGRYTYNVSKNIQKHTKYNMAFFYGYTSKELLQTGKRSKEQYLKSIISKNDYVKRLFRKIIHIAGSEFSEQEILQKLNFPQEKVVYHGINHDVFRVYDNVGLSFDLPEKFIFCVGSIEPRKNLLGLLQAYNRATLFVFPSFYEGFGLPVLEAMACATPVVCSDSSSLPEVGNDAARYFDPNNIADITETINRVLKDEDLQKEMLQKGLQITKKFTWEKSAQQHNEIFQKVLRSK